MNQEELDKLEALQTPEGEVLLVVGRTPGGIVFARLSTNTVELSEHALKSAPNWIPLPTAIAIQAVQIRSK
jgi:hypothetical protein